MTSYRIVTYKKNNSNKTTQNKTKKTTKENNQKRGKMDHLRHFTLKHELLKISVYFKIEFAAKTHLAEGQFLKEQLKFKLHMV
jgi:hypothetical protein